MILACVVGKLRLEKRATPPVRVRLAYTITCSAYATGPPAGESSFLEVPHEQAWVPGGANDCLAAHILRQRPSESGVIGVGNRACWLMQYLGKELYEVDLAAVADCYWPAAAAGFSLAVPIFPLYRPPDRKLTL